MKRALESYLRKCIHEWSQPQTATRHDLLLRARRHLAKVTSFYLGSYAIILELWLLFECCFVSLVLLIGFMRSKGTFKSGQAIDKDVHLLPLHEEDDEAQESRTTLLQGGGSDAARPAVVTTSCTSSTTHALKGQVTEAWRQRRKKRSRKTSTQRYYRPQSSGTTVPVQSRNPNAKSTCRSGTTAPGERYYRRPGAVLPVLRAEFSCEFLPFVPLRGLDYK